MSGANLTRRVSVTGSGTAMAREIAEIPEVTSRQVSRGLTEYRAIGAHLRRRAPAVIVTCARGSSDNAAVYLKYLVETRIGIPVAAIGPSVASVYDARLSLDRAVCVTISQSGGSPDLVSLQGPRARGRRRDAGAAQHPGLARRVRRGPGRAGHGGPGDGRGGDQVAGRLPGRDRGHRRRLDGGRHVGQWAGRACRTRSRRRWRASWDHALSAIAGANSLYVIGRGPGYAIAREAALKLKETCRLHAEAYSAAEVQHGPIAIARSRPRDRFVALMFHARDASRASLEQACAAIRSIGAPVFVADSEERGPSALPVAAAAHPLLDPICQITSFYRFVEALSTELGEDPDRPEHLRKVTETL